MPGLLGSDLLRVRPDYRIIPNPFKAGEQTVVVPAIQPDVAVLHAVRAQPDGAAIFPAGGDAVLLARAARRVIVTAEDIYDGAATVLTADEQFLPGIYVDAVVRAPHGCWPLGLRGRYGADAEAIAAYVQAARAPTDLPAFLAAFVAYDARVAVNV